MNVIGVKLVGDPTELQRALVTGGQAVTQFGQQTEKSLAKVSSETAQATKEQRELAGAVASTRSALFQLTGIGLSFAGIKQAAQALLETQVQADRLRNSLNFAVGKDNAGRDMGFIRDTAKTLGLELVSTASQYTMLAASSRGTNMEGRQTKELFTALAGASTVLGMNVEQTEGAFRAVQQMMSKGKVQAEELRGQLGERLPGAFQIAARAMGVTTGELDKMLETGQVMADDFLPRFAAQLKKELGESVPESAQSAQAAINRLSTAWFDFKTNVNDSGVGAAMVGGIKGFTAVLDVVGGSLKSLTNDGDLRKAADDVLALDKRATILRNGMAMGFYGPGMKDELTYVNGQLAIAKTRFNELDAARRGLQSGSNEANLRAQFPTRDKSFDNDAERRSKDRAKLDALAGRLSGQGQNFQRDLAELNRLRQAPNSPIANDDEYRRLVGQLIEKDGGVKKPGAASGGARSGSGNSPAGAVFQRISERTAELRAEATQDAPRSAAQRDALKILEELRTGTLKLTEAEKQRLGVALSDMLAQDAINTASKAAAKTLADNAKIIEKNTEAEDKYLESLHKRVQGEVEANAKITEETAVIGLNAEQRAERLALIERETIAQLELNLVNERNIDGNEKAVALLEQELLLRRQRIRLLDNKAGAERDDTARTDAKKQSEDFANDLRGDLRGALSAAFRDTKNPIKAFGDALGNVIYTRVTESLADAMATELLTGLGVGGLKKSGGGGGNWLGDVLNLFGGGGGGRAGDVMGATGNFSRMDRLGSGAGIAGGGGLLEDLMSFGVFHTGGVVGKEQPAARQAPAALFAGAPKFHTGGLVAGRAADGGGGAPALASDEVPIIARRGEGVFTREQMRALAPVGPITDSPPLRAGGMGGNASAGRVVQSASFGAFHSGGVVGKEQPGERQASAALFAGAPKFHAGGMVGGASGGNTPALASDEVPIIARKGESVLTREQMRALAPAGSGSTTVQGATYNLTFNGGVSRAEVVAGLQQARQAAVSDVVDGQRRRRF